MEEHKIENLENSTDEREKLFQTFDLKRISVDNDAITSSSNKNKVFILAILKGVGLTEGTIQSTLPDVDQCFLKAFGHVLNKKIQEKSFPQVTIAQIPECIIAEKQTAPLSTRSDYYEGSVVKQSEDEIDKNIFVMPIYHSEAIKFSGDIDRDGLMDFIVTIYDGVYLLDRYPVALWLSSKISPKNPMGIVASDTWCRKS